MRSALLAATVALGALAAQGACGDDEVADKTAVCRMQAARGTATSAATVQDRKIIGAAAPYAPDLGLAARDAELEGSIAARRAAAWEIVARVLRPVPLAEARLADQFPSQPAIPAWHTWYARDDFERVFKHLYRELGAAGRAARAPIDGAAGLAWNPTALDDIPEWPEQRYLEYLAEIDTAEEAGGVGGAHRVGYSPGALTHLLESYRELHACRTNPEPAAHEAGALTGARVVVQRDTLEVAACEFRVLGPFQAAPGAVRVTSRGVAPGGDVDLYVRRGEPPDHETYDCISRGGGNDEACTVDGGGPVYVLVFGAAPARVEIDVEHAIADVAAPACLDGAMPRDAVLVKADWRRQLPGELLPIYDSSGPRMTSRLAGEGTWNNDGAADPQAAAIYTIALPTGARFRMPALHVMTKELDHWMWITLWWSPSPDGDFGADRPAAIAALPGPWRHYKMCVATGYLEQDPDPRGGFGGSLGDALAAVHRGVGAPTWCSNPYLEQGKGNADTNCIGCHQHGGTALTAEAILADLPDHGRTRVRNNFFTDYLWAVQGGAGEDLSALVQAEVDYWDAND